MLYFYYYFVGLTLAHPLLRSWTTLAVALTFPFFLLTLPDTGYDFSQYETAYDRTYFDVTAPLFFRSSSVLTAEAGWFAYTGIVGLLIPDFRYFLVFNFLLCLGLLYHAARLLKISPKDFGLMTIMFLPVCFIVIMFWSPRSSLPFALVVLGIAYLQNKSRILAALLFAGAALIHTQYSAFIVVSLIYFTFRHTAFFAKRQVLILVMAGVLLIGIVVFRQAVVSLLSFLPTAEFAQSKLRTFEVTSSGFRTSAILSVVIYPAFLLVRFKYLKVRPEIDVVMVMVFLSLVLNIAFYDNTHVAGRLSRASDYFLFAYVFSQTALGISPRLGSLLLLPVVVLLPFAYADLYDAREIYSFLYNN